jgi:UTP--glucose-1-phosphate uridylyltransferase
MRAKKVRKAVFPVAGYGTRFLPVTKAYPKEMLPIIDKPLIQFAAEEAIAAGCTELIFVTSHAKKAIEDHFDRNLVLEQHLLERQEFGLIKAINAITPPEVTCIYIRQSQQRGLGHAVACAKNLIQDEPFAVILADDLIKSRSGCCLRDMVQHYEQSGHSVIAVQEVAIEELSNYGVVEFLNGKDGYIKRIIEKPSIEQAPSRFAAVGRYVLSAEIFQFLDQQNAVGANNEIQLTDALDKLLAVKQMFGMPLDGVRYDCGKKTGYLQAIIETALADPVYREVILQAVQEAECV